MNYYKNKTSLVCPKMQKARANKTGAFFYVGGGLNFSRGISHGRVMVPSPKIVFKNFPGHIRSYPVNQNYIGSAISFGTDRQTNKHPVTLL